METFDNDKVVITKKGFKLVPACDHFNENDIKVLERITRARQLSISFLKPKYSKINPNITDEELYEIFKNGFIDHTKCVLTHDILLHDIHDKYIKDKNIEIHRMFFDAENENIYVMYPLKEEEQC